MSSFTALALARYPVDVKINHETGYLDTSADKIPMPYAMSLFVKELESSHIDLKLITKE